MVLTDDMSLDLQGRDAGEPMVQSSSAGRLKYTKQRLWSVFKGMKKLISPCTGTQARGVFLPGESISSFLLYPNKQLIRQIPPILITIISHPLKGNIP